MVGEAQNGPDHKINSLSCDDVLQKRYRLVHEIGRGGMGVVWLARDEQLDNREVAIKLLPTILSGDRRSIDRLKQEAVRLLELNHPFIVRLNNFEQDDDRDEQPFLVMQFVKGQTANDILIDHPRGLPLELVIKWVRRIAMALDYAHSQDVLHRDLKPSNIMINAKGKALLMDFGIARVLKDSYTHLTGKVDEGGTPLYMSPQHLVGEDHPSNDIYSFAATIYELLSGNPPFLTGDIAYQIKNVMPKRIETLQSFVNDGLLTGLAKEINDRPKLATDLVRRIDPDNLKSATRSKSPAPLALEDKPESLRRDPHPPTPQRDVPTVRLPPGLRPRQERDKEDDPAEVSARVTIIKSSESESYDSTSSDATIVEVEPTDLEDLLLSDAGMPVLMRKKPIIVGILVIVLLFVVNGVLRWQMPQNKRSVDNMISTPSNPSSPVSGIPDDPQHLSRMPITISSGLYMEFIYLQPDSFVMGIADHEVSRRKHEYLHEVTLSRSFYVGVTEVTQSQWNAVMETNPSSFGPDDQLPVDSVSWNDAVLFCKKLSKQTGYHIRLPTEAEWEYACRGGTMSAFAFTRDQEFTYYSSLTLYAWYSQNSDSRSHPVGEKLPNSWGFQDMHGNLAEWCNDYYGKYDPNLMLDPVGPSEGTTRVMRGGSWLHKAEEARSAFRSSRTPSQSYSHCGFRVVLEMK